jgi:hypothetical protein
MSEARAVVDAGTCGFVSTVVANVDTGKRATFTVETECEHVQAIVAALADSEPFDVFDDMRWQTESRLRGTIRTALKSCYPWCPVPMGMFKAMQLAAGLSLPQDVVIELSMTAPDGSITATDQ